MAKLATAAEEEALIASGRRQLPGPGFHVGAAIVWKGSALPDVYSAIIVDGPATSVSGLVLWKVRSLIDGKHYWTKEGAYTAMFSYDVLCDARYLYENLPHYSAVALTVVERAVVISKIAKVITQSRHVGRAIAKHEHRLLSLRKRERRKRMAELRAKRQAEHDAAVIMSGLRAISFDEDMV